MAPTSPMLNLLPNIYQGGHTIAQPENVPAKSRRLCMVAGIALAMFIALFGWGASYFGWQDPSGKVQLALFTSFILGIIASYKSRG
jgi:hypothetical protein